MHILHRVASWCLMWLQVGALPAELHAAKQLRFLQLLHCGVTDVGLLPPGCQQLDVVDSVPVTFSRSSLRAGISQAHQVHGARSACSEPHTLVLVPRSLAGCLLQLRSSR